MRPREDTFNPTSQVIRTTLAEPMADWDATVRHAFLEGCVQQGVRSELSSEALARGANSPDAERELRAAAEDGARRAALAWLTIETCLEQYGELAALALERCIEEASLQVRRSSMAPGSTLRVTGATRTRDECASAIIDRGRARLQRFWEASAA